MALNITHQIATLAGTTIPVESGAGSGDSTASTVSASAVWKSPAAATSRRCRIQKSEFADGGSSGSPPLSPCRSRPLSPCQSPPPLSPRVSPPLGGIRADLSAACRAFATELEAPMAAPPVEESISVSEHREVRAPGKGRGVPVYVMLPLDSVTMNHTVNRRKAMNASLQALKSAGVEGIMMDVWWGLVEGDAPGAYNWGGYNELMEMAKKHGLKVQAVMSFHKCGGNVGDSCKYVIHLSFISLSLFYKKTKSKKIVKCFCNFRIY